MEKQEHSKTFEITDKIIKENILKREKTKFSLINRYIKLPIVYENVNRRIIKINAEDIKKYMKLYDLYPKRNELITGGYYKNKNRTIKCKYSSTKCTKRGTTIKSKSNSKSRTKSKRGVSKTKTIH